jgi:hypothetical protein
MNTNESNLGNAITLGVQAHGYKGKVVELAGKDSSFRIIGPDTRCHRFAYAHENGKTFILQVGLNDPIEDDEREKLHSDPGQIKVLVNEVIEVLDHWTKLSKCLTS